MSLPFPARTDIVVGANDLVFANTFDAVNIALQNLLEAEHTVDGEHRFETALSGRCVRLCGTYTGNAADNRNIVVSNANAKGLFLKITDATSGKAWLKTASMSGDTAKDASGGAFAANYIQSLGTGTFQVGTGLNVSGRVYVYAFYGILTVFPGNEVWPEEISWIQHGEDIIDLTSEPTGIFRVSALIRDKFGAGHSLTTGAHLSPIYGTHGNLAVGTYAGTAATQVVSVSSAFPVTHVIVFANTATSVPVLKTSLIPGNSVTYYYPANATVYRNTTFFDGIGSLTLGAFSVVGSTAYCNQSGVTYYYVAFGRG